LSIRGLAGAWQVPASLEVPAAGCARVARARGGRPCRRFRVGRGRPGRFLRAAIARRSGWLLWMRMLKTEAEADLRAAPGCDIRCDADRALSVYSDL
jgi:hypothetical protein